MAKSINETKELVNLLGKMYNEDTVSFNVDHSNKQKKLMNEVDNLEVIINVLNQEVDSLIGMAEKINKKLENNAY